MASGTRGIAGAGRACSVAATAFLKTRFGEPTSMRRWRLAPPRNLVLFQSVAAFLFDLSAALKFVFNRRRFAFGFIAGWAFAILLNELLRYVFHNDGLLSNGLHNFRVIFGG